MIETLDPATGELVPSFEGEPVTGRPAEVRERLHAISRDVSASYIENGLLLQEAQNNAYHRAWGFTDFDEAIDALHEQGVLDYSSRNARNFIAVVSMIQRQQLDPAAVSKIAISKLREIATLKDAASQRALLDSCHGMSVADVQKEAKRLRAKAAGHDIDPLNPITLMMTDTMKGFFRECMVKAREEYALESTLPDVNVLVDSVLPEWFNSL